MSENSAATRSDKPQNSNPNQSRNNRRRRFKGNRSNQPKTNQPKSDQQPTEKKNEAPKAKPAPSRRPKPEKRQSGRRPGTGSRRRNNDRRPQRGMSREQQQRLNSLDSRNFEYEGYTVWVAIVKIIPFVLKSRKFRTHIIDIFLNGEEIPVQSFSDLEKLKKVESVDPNEIEGIKNIQVKFIAEAGKMDIPVAAELWPQIKPVEETETPTEPAETFDAETNSIEKSEKAV
jgi:hypothetical protein